MAQNKNEFDTSALQYKEVRLQKFTDKEACCSEGCLKYEWKIDWKEKL